MDPMTVVSSTWPAVRTTKTSPSPWSKMISAATRESEHPKMTANGCCAALSSARWSTPCDGCSISPRTNRSLPARSADQASAGVGGRDTRVIVAGRCGPRTQRPERNGVQGGRPTACHVPGRGCSPRTRRLRGRGADVQRRSRGLALIAGLALIVPLAACASEGSGPPVLTWYINPDDGGQADIAADCTKSADGAYRIETSVLPRDASAQREQLARRLAAKDASIDIMSLDPPFIPELAEPGFLAPIPDDVAQRVSENVVQGALAGSTWGDKLVAVPFWANTQLLWYRKSVAQAAGLDPAKTPVTWQQIMDAAGSQDKYLAVQGTKAESLTVWINALVESAGGKILENPEAPADELKLGLETPAGKAAAQIIGDIGSQNLGGPALPTEDENASMSIFQGDRGSFMVNWPFVWSATNAAVKDGTLPASLIEDVGWAIYPQVAEGTAAAPPYGGISLGIGAFSKYVKEAFAAAECIVTPEHQAQYFVSNGNPASNTEAYDDPAVLKAFPMADVIRQSLEQAAPRPQTPYYNEVSVGLQQTWHPPSAVNPKTTPAESQTYITAVLRGEQLL